MTAKHPPRWLMKMTRKPIRWATSNMPQTKRQRFALWAVSRFMEATLKAGMWNDEVRRR